MPCVDGGPHTGEADDFGCRVKHFSVNPYAMTSRLHGSKAPKPPNNVWERGIPTDQRGMPYLEKGGDAMGQKEFSERRHEIEQKRRFLHNSTTPVPPPPTLAALAHKE